MLFYIALKFDPMEAKPEIHMQLSKHNIYFLATTTKKGI